MCMNMVAAFIRLGLQRICANYMNVDVASLPGWFSYGGVPHSPCMPHFTQARLPVWLVRTCCDILGVCCRRQRVVAMSVPHLRLVNMVRCDQLQRATQCPPARAAVDGRELPRMWGSNLHVQRLLRRKPLLLCAALHQRLGWWKPMCGTPVGS